MILNITNLALELRKRKLFFTYLLIGMLFIMFGVFNLILYKKLTNTGTKTSRLEYHLSQLQTNWLNYKEASNLQLKSSTEHLQQKFNELSANVGQIESTEPGYHLRATLRLTTLAAMQLALNKEEPLAKELLKHAINKLIKLNDPRLNPTLYNLQDEYSYLLNEDTNNTKEVFQKINKIQSLLEQLQSARSSDIEMSDLFPDAKNNAAIAQVAFFTVEVLNIYLEQIKLAFAQNNEFLYKQAINAINKGLKLVILAPKTVLEIQELLSWLATIEIKNYSLLLQAILNLEDLL